MQHSALVRRWRQTAVVRESPRLPSPSSASRVERACLVTCSTEAEPPTHAPSKRSDSRSPARSVAAFTMESPPNHELVARLASDRPDDSGGRGRSELCHSTWIRRAQNRDFACKRDHAGRAAASSSRRLDARLEAHARTTPFGIVTASRRSGLRKSLCTAGIT